jgi:methylenetetrahydrofolate dehydrogenase (NADP+) / methenyltetrahydrofolate cyclohydrolase
MALMKRDRQSSPARAGVDLPGVDGILVQHPMPAHIDERAVFEAIASAKDVDGVTQASFTAMALGSKGFHSCTPGGIMALLDDYDVDAAGLRAVVVGRSSILGKPVGMLLLARQCHCHLLPLQDCRPRSDRR